MLNKDVKNYLIDNNWDEGNNCFYYSDNIYTIYVNIAEGEFTTITIDESDEPAEKMFSDIVTIDAIEEAVEEIEKYIRVDGIRDIILGEEMTFVDLDNTLMGEGYDTVFDGDTDTILDSGSVVYSYDGKNELFIAFEVYDKFDDTLYITKVAVF